MIIYDVDDLGDALWHWVAPRHFRAMLRIADTVTTCSLPLLQHLAKNYPTITVANIPNAIDYFPSGPARRPLPSNTQLRLVWFGNSSNFWMIEKYIPALLAIPESELWIISNLDELGGRTKTHPGVRFLAWSLGDFVSMLQQCDVAVLTHDGNKEALTKGNNRMTTAITWGLPVVASRTPEYERTADESGTSRWLFSNPRELVEAIEHLRNEKVRTDYLDVAQPAIWRRYAPPVIATSLANLAFGLRAHKCSGSCGVKS
ncbi:MAG: glycosyltransferase [Candidatus Accumulibacter sp.]|uniref:Glycosyltransferase n=1 Tax=Candidatus Accumulibacter affinis TaxID=2954384 RepID=A0A935TCP5_9PROT|nr:glycosyltransferase [Candidatus Accumulibacter affinis]